MNDSRWLFDFGAGVSAIPFVWPTFFPSGELVCDLPPTPFGCVMEGRVPLLDLGEMLVPLVGLDSSGDEPGPGGGDGADVAGLLLLPPVAFGESPPPPLTCLTGDLPLVATGFLPGGDFTVTAGGLAGATGMLSARGVDPECCRTRPRTGNDTEPDLVPRGRSQAQHPPVAALPVRKFRKDVVFCLTRQVSQALLKENIFAQLNKHGAP